MARRRADDGLLWSLLTAVIVVVGTMLFVLFRLLVELIKLIHRNYLASRKPRATRQAQASTSKVETSRSSSNEDKAHALACEGLLDESQGWYPSDEACKHNVVFARRALWSEDFDTARFHYQKVAYGLRVLTDAEKQLLKREVSYFAGHDPLYAELLSKVQVIIGQHPGILQSQLTKRSGVERELMSYVLYYAEARGEIVRHRKGRSYELTLPFALIEPETSLANGLIKSACERALTPDLATEVAENTEVAPQRPIIKSKHV